jgi:hypothetical protein
MQRKTDEELTKVWRENDYAAWADNPREVVQT